MYFFDKNINFDVFEYLMTYLNIRFSIIGVFEWFPTLIESTMLICDVLSNVCEGGVGSKAPNFLPWSIIFITFSTIKHFQLHYCIYTLSSTCFFLIKQCYYYVMFKWQIFQNIELQNISVFYTNVLVYHIWPKLVLFLLTFIYELWFT